MNVFRIWSDYFGDLPPLGHLLRESLQDRWLRIHSLPGSKRYAEHELEYSALLSRHGQVSREILGVDTAALLFAPIWGDNDVAPPLSVFDWASRAGLIQVIPTEFPSPETDEPPIRVVGCSIRWSANQWSDLLRDVADDRSRVVLLNPATGEVYAPYDGGADLFLTSHERVGILRQRWAAWLPTHAMGL